MRGFNSQTCLAKFKPLTCPPFFGAPRRAGILSLGERKVTMLMPYDRNLL